MWRTNGVERTVGEETPLADDIHPGWVGGPVMVAVDIHEKLRLELLEKSLGHIFVL